MELTPTQAGEMLMKRMQEHPEIAEVFYAENFRKELGNILEFHNISISLLPVVEREILIVLAFYAPISNLSKNIAESAHFPLETADKIVTMVEAILLPSLSDTLMAFDIAWHAQLEKEKNTPEYVSYILRSGSLEELGTLSKEKLLPVLTEIPTSILRNMMSRNILSPSDQKELRKELESKGTDVQKDWLLYTPTGNIFGK